ncbi:MAG TPA: hypothetical protein VFQ91_16515 [Bryobacteraceae bacterium]|nr:hypothetical protein [Bryobacteraceae bacterium]
MPEDIFEESTIAIKATLKEDGFFSGSYTGKLDLIYKKNDAEISRDANIDVPQGSVDRTYKVPKVEGTEDTYGLKVIANYGKAKEKTRVLVDATVWPKKVKLTAKNFVGDVPAKNLPYTIRHTSLWFGKTTDGHTNDAGVGEEDLKKSPYTIELKAPWEIVTNKNDAHKREHDLVVRNNPKAKFLKPDFSQDCYVAAGTDNDKNKGVRHYVNMTTADNGNDAMGNIVEFEVCNKEQPQGIKDEKIYIQVKFTKLSKRNLPKPALLAPCEEIAEKDDGKTLTGSVKLPANGGSAKFKLELGYAGGETFTVTCGYSKDDPTDDKRILVSWRKLGYQLGYPVVMKARLIERTRKDGNKYYDIPDSIKNVVKTRLDAVFVEYENIKSHEYPNPPAGSAAIVKTKFLDGGNDNTELYVLDGGQNWAVTATPFDAAADNREIHVTLCDRAYSSGGKVLTPTLILNKQDHELSIDPEHWHAYFEKTHKAVDTVNFKTAGYEWKAKMDLVSAPDKNKKPSFDSAHTAGDGGGERKLIISEPTVGGPALTVTCEANNSISPGEKAKIKNYYEACFTDAKKLRQAKNELHFQVTGPTGGDGDDVRLQAVQAALSEVHTASAKKLLYHPGLDDDGNPRTGPMSDVTMGHTNRIVKKFTLATGGVDKPGDFIGAASADKCPIAVEFSMDGTYAINGNAGGGSQLLVLRDNVPGPCAGTVCHELGHAMGMSVMPLTGGSKYPVPPGITTPKHVDNGGAYYLDGISPFTNGIRNLHRGPHCSDGMPTGKRPDSKFNDWSPGASDNVCIMWGSGGDDDNRKKYCTVCTEILKARRLTDVRGDWDGRAEG